MIVVDHGKKWCHCCFKGICGSICDTLGERLILFLTVLFVGEEWLGLLTLFRFIKGISFSDVVASR